MRFRKYPPPGAKENKALIGLKVKATLKDLLSTSAFLRTNKGLW